MKTTIQSIKDQNLTSQQLVANVRQHVYERELNIANLVCPQCGGALIRREGPHGRFYGCSNYPQCKFTTK